jgi:non-ribosomal peptide synthetase component F
VGGLPSFCFDFSVWELWGALATGATAVIVPRQTGLSYAELIEFVQEQQITVLNQRRRPSATPRKHTPKAVIRGSRCATSSSVGKA